MLTEDYLMRQIRLFTAALARALGLKTMQLHQDAIWVLDQALEQLFGLPLDVLNRMDDNSLMAAVRGQDKNDLSRLRMAAELYSEQGELYHGLQEPGESSWRLVRALNLYLEVELSGGASGFAPAAEKINPLVDRLGYERIPPDLLYPLFGWAEQTAQTQLAVNTLVRLLEVYPDEAELKEEGSNFLQDIRQNATLADPANACLNLDHLEELLASR
jgi:hypothetical protein